MNNVSPNISRGSPKTPGGISKSLLTPCRRVGLSKKWRKNGCSSFISPLSGQNATPESRQLPEEKKRKNTDEIDHLETNSESTNEKHNESSLDSPITGDVSNKNNDIISTPCRNISFSRKRYKTLSLKNRQETEDVLSTAIQLPHYNKNKLDEPQTNEVNAIQDKNINDNSNKHKTAEANVTMTPVKQISNENISKPARTKTKSKLTLNRSSSKNDCNDKPVEPIQVNIENIKPKEKSPNNLSKECFVVIQKKILEVNPEVGTTKQVDETVQNSDSEVDIPLSEIKKETTYEITLNTLDDDDFINQPVKKPKRNLSIKRNKVIAKDTESSCSSQSSQEATNKKTIVIKKTYDKVVKPLKAKSTGSITQKDIDDIKARIEMKKKLLLAKAMSIDTEELRDLIKKWQKGCQDALMELLNLMKKKLPDRQNMDYSEILATLKIPAELVGYDSDNDCFVTPDDNNMLLSAFKL